GHAAGIDRCWNRFGRGFRIDAPHGKPALRRQPDRPVDFHPDRRVAGYSRSRGMLPAGPTCDKGGSDHCPPLRVKTARTASNSNKSGVRRAICNSVHFFTTLRSEQAVWPRNTDSQKYERDPESAVDYALNWQYSSSGSSFEQPTDMR